MPWFEYEGLTPGGTAVAGRLEASNHEQATHDLALMQVQVRRIEAASAPRASARLGAEDLIFFNEQLASLAEAGIALDEGLAQLARDLESSNLKRWIADLVQDLRRGVPLDQAVAAREQGLPILYSRVIRAGIQNGELPATLLNLNQHLRLAGETRQLVWELVSYPLIIAIAAICVISAFFIGVVPKLVEIFKDFGTQLPLVTIWMVHISFIYPQILATVAIVFVVLAAAWKGLKLSNGGRSFREGILLGLPLLGNLIRCSLIARFLRMISMAVASGVPMPQALRLAADATGSPTMIRDADRLAGEVEHGESIFAANQSSRIIPPLFGFCVQVATGRDALPVAVAQLAKAYENRATQALGMVRVILLPVIILLLGTIMLIGIAGMFLPLVSLINCVSGGG
jgi:type II secretory pathway component PulF